MHKKNKNINKENYSLVLILREVNSGIPMIFYAIFDC